MKVAQRFLAGESSPDRLVGLAPLIVATILIIVLPLVLPAYLQSLMTRMLIFAIFAMSLDLIFGYAGLISLGHAAFFGVSAYTVGILMVRYDVDLFWLGAPAAILASALVAAVFGIIALRVTGLYFILVTFALGQLVFSITFSVGWFTTAGTEGVTGISRPDLGFLDIAWSNRSYFYFVAVFFAICGFVLYRIVKSPFGIALQGIRENEQRMRALGYNTWLYRYIAYVIAGTFAGVAGVFFAYHNGLIAPSNVGFLMSGLVMFMVIIGGVATLYGAVLGAVGITLLQFFAADYTPERWPLILGGVFIVSVMFARQGFGVYLYRMWKRAIS